MDFAAHTPEIGSKVRIVSEWNIVEADETESYWNREGYMDEYLGTIMTVKEIIYRDEDQLPFLKMEEDTRANHATFSSGWSWFPHMIECLVDDEDLGELEELDSRLLSDMIGGGV